MSGQMYGYSIEDLYAKVLPTTWVTVTGTAAPAASAAAQPAPASPTASASDLQILIASIPTAHDGQVITADYHNALRLALVAIANRLGLGPVKEEITVTVPPRLAAAGGGAVAWAQEPGVAVQGTATSGPVKGWTEADLPDGARIKKMVVYATKTGSGTVTIRLLRQKVTDPTTAPILAEVTVAATATLATGIEADVTLPGTGAGVTAIEEFRVVDTRQYKYLVTAEIDNVSGTTVKLAGVQIVLGR